MACCINLACAIVPACIGAIRSGSGDGEELGMFTLLCSCGLAAAGVGAALSAGMFDEDEFKYVDMKEEEEETRGVRCLLYTSPSPRDRQKSRMPSSA